jgi:hypothetical protein
VWEVEAFGDNLGADDNVNIAVVKFLVITGDVRRCVAVESGNTGVRK